MSPINPLVKKTVLHSAAYFLLSLSILWTINHFKLNWVQVWLVFVGISTAIMLVQRQFSFKQLFKNAAIALVLILAFKFLQPLGWWGAAAAFTLVLAYIFITRWKTYIFWKHHIETMIWGQPLYKFKEQGTKPPKVKIKW